MRLLGTESRSQVRSVVQSMRIAGRSARTYAKQFLVRVPDPTFQLEGLEYDHQRADNALATLKANGIVVLPAYFSGPALEGMKQAFDELFTGKESTADRETLYAEGVTEKDRSFLVPALDDLILHVVAGYYRKGFFLTRADAMRLMPASPERYGSFQWHHDTRGRQAKAMILLTDVDARGQRMQYVRGSHRRYYPHDRMYGQGSRFEDDLVRQPVPSDEVIDVIGPAGTLAIFDTNGLHCGNRNTFGGRDTLTYCYTTGRVMLKLRYRREDVDALPPCKREIITGNPHHELI